MKATLVPDKLTSLSAAEVCRAFAVAFFKLTGVRATDRTLCILLAQSALESGRWKALHCYNLANVKASEAYEGLYCEYRCNEIINGKVEWFSPPHPQCRFRAYQVLDDAAFDYLSFLHNRARYRPAWERAVAGDAAGFVAALKRGGFFTASEEPYKKAVVSLTNEYAQHVATWRSDYTTKTPEPAETDVDTDEELRALATGAAVESRLALLDDRSDAHAEMREADPEEETRPDNPPVRS
jgi:hypothetical protein